MSNMNKKHIKSSINLPIISILSIIIFFSTGKNAYAKTVSKEIVPSEEVVKVINLECPSEEVDNNLTPNQTYYGYLTGGRIDTYIGKTLYLLSPMKKVVGCSVIERLSNGSIGYRFTRALGTVPEEWDYGYTFKGMEDGESVTFFMDNKVVKTSISPVIWHPDYMFIKIDLILPRNFINK